MSICKDKETKVKYAELNHCRFQYVETIKAKGNIEKWNAAAIDMQGRGKQTKI